MSDAENTLPPPEVSDDDLRDTLRAIAHPLVEGDLSGYDPLLDLVGDARIVLIGDASHGTHEFYRERALITTRLIAEKNFSLIALEADWPEGATVDRYLQGGRGDAAQALETFSNYPTWMWGNLDFLQFIDWLRRYNDALPARQERVHLYGIDVRNLAGAADMIGDYLQHVDPSLAQRAAPLLHHFAFFIAGLRDAYAARDEQIGPERFADEAREIYALMGAVPPSGDDASFLARQAARVILNGERFYEAAARKARPEGWNIRDTHMMDTLDALLDRYPGRRVVVWQHNSHIGDFRYTGDPGGMINIGELVRLRHPGESVAVGFGTYTGTVTATREWGQRPQHMEVPPAQPDSYDGVFHETGLDRLLLLLSPLRGQSDGRGLSEWRGQRAIGVVYNPEDESRNFVPTQLANRYDAYVFIDRTRALRPLRDEPTWESPLTMDTYPAGY